VSLTSKDVEEITRLLEQSSFDELYLEINGFKLSLKRGGAAATTAPSSPAPAPSAPAPALASSPEFGQSAPTAAPSADGKVRGVTAPLLGTFYRAPKPGEPPFIEIGSHVEADTIIGIIEVMKLMNTVRAGMRGTVVEILGRDGALVEYGETLLRVDTTA
jgi:acetyl-CoA carboxylase biotin carboxyl carrier protein